MKNPVRFISPLLALLGAVALLPAAMPEKPNVLFISIDDLRDWVGYIDHDHQAKTPNLDRLAKMGTSFTHSYCASPSCNPSRTAVLSGLRPSTSGVYENYNDWRTAIPIEITLPTTFRKAGYTVVGSGKVYHDNYRRNEEWDDYLSKEKEGKMPRLPDGVGGIRFAPVDCRDEDLNDWNIVTYGIEQLAQKHAKPFFLAVGVHKPHMPWDVPRKYFDMFPLDSIHLPPYLKTDLSDVPPAGVEMALREPDHALMVKSGRWKEAIQGYLAAIVYADVNVGRLLDALEKSAYRDNTIIVVWGDHGWHLGEKDHWRKFALWEETTRAPLTWIVPGLTKPGTICDRTIDLMSIYPTLTDLCGIPTPKHVEGESIRELLANPQAKWDRPALSTYLFNNHAVRSSDWRYIRYANGNEELYDEIKDPNEWTNLAKEPQYAATKVELAKFMPVKNAAEISHVPRRNAAKKDAEGE